MNLTALPYRHLVPKRKLVDVPNSSCWPWEWLSSVMTSTSSSLLASNSCWSSSETQASSLASCSLRSSSSPTSKSRLTYCILLYCHSRRMHDPHSGTSSLSRIPLKNFGRRFGYSRSLPFNQRERGIQIGPKRKKKEEKPKTTLNGYQNRKTASIFLRKPKTGC